VGAIALGAVTIALVLWGEPARASLSELLGIASWEGAGRRTAFQALGLLLLIGLTLSVDPEIRGFLLFVNDMGLDIFLLLLTIQGRGYLLLLNEAVVLPTARSLANWGWYPVVLPSRWLLREHPFWGVYATVKPVVVAAMIVALSVAAMWPLGVAARGFF
jgi:hypothetical protein